MNWFHTATLPHLRCSAPEDQIKCMMRFIVGSTDLRCYDHSICNRAHRTCTLCDTMNIEDELHITLECTTYDELREQQQWRPLFDSRYTTDLRSFIGQPQQNRLCGFIFALFKFRDSQLHGSRRNWFSSPPIRRRTRRLSTFSDDEDEVFTPPPLFP